ncbi:MAG: ribonuclease HIII [Candidatus Melainabacteria bacterium GWF2_37_15]|nr:MAG: ribonuclease HIII [Candidatus Melainabacteria bacterium GWF2_37_15]
MTAVSLVSLNLSEQELKSDLENKGFEFKPAEHAYWRAQKDGLTITLYKSGKILVQGKGAEEFFSPNRMDCFVEPKGSPRNDISKHNSWIGTDESGKGDYFGPLVVAGVLVDEKNMNQLITLGVQDSKKINDTTIHKLAPKIKEISTFAVVTINPAKYNELYSKFKNLNNLLAWGHARAIENILEKTPCEYALSDKFGNESLIKNALLKNGRNIILEQRTKAEDDIAVAAASVLARDEFLTRLKKFSTEYGINLPKGASAEVLKQAGVFVSKYGIEKLNNVAKIHFKCTQQIKAL